MPRRVQSSKADGAGQGARPTVQAEGQGRRLVHPRLGHLSCKGVITGLLGGYQMFIWGYYDHHNFHIHYNRPNRHNHHKLIMILIITIYLSLSTSSLYLPNHLIWLDNKLINTHSLISSNNINSQTMMITRRRITTMITH